MVVGVGELGTMMEEPERGLPENRKWTQINMNMIDR
jgi:hypothetical protein